MPAVPIVEVEALTKRYPATLALDAVTLGVEEGEIFALLGPNGAGKTTLIGCVAGLITPTSGRARVAGKDVTRDYLATRRVVGLVPQEINFDPFFDVEEILRFQAGFFGARLDDAYLTELLEALSLADQRHTRTRALSGGMKRRLLIAKALVHRPHVLFLYEPTAGVDVELRRDLWRYVRTLRSRGTTVILTTHYLEEAEELADRIGLIRDGRLILVERTAELLARHGHRTLRLTVKAPAVVPPALAARGGRLADANTIEIAQPGGEPLGALLADAIAAGLTIEDVETRRSALEDVYVALVQDRA